LIAYDYGMGGLWGVMLARSEDDIREKYPELVIVKERPVWMTDESHTRLYREDRHDIDAPPSGMLKAVLGERKRE
jgi:hypothetical protein